ncbi:MAG TPA: hypothetical protein VGB56_11735 [Flavisolibacter sp.]
MKTILCLLGILFLGTSHSSAQSLADTIYMKNPKKIFFYRHGVKLTPQQLTEVTATNPEAHKLMRKARTNATVAGVLGFAGGFLIGFPVGTAIGGGKPNWGLAGAGAGLLLTSVPFSLSYARKAKEAVNIYNSGLARTGQRRLDFRLGLGLNGLAMKVNF